MKTSSFSFLRIRQFVPRGTRKTKIYQRFVGSRQEVFILKIQNDENIAAQQDNGRRFHIKTMKGGHFHPASLRTGFFMPRKEDLQMADDKKNIPEAAPSAEAPAPTVEKAAHGKGQGRQARQRPFSQGR